MKDKNRDLLERVQRITSRGTSRALGVKITKIEPGFCQGEIEVKEVNQNPYHWVHGGSLMTLADTVAGLAAGYGTDVVTTIGANFHFVKPGKETKKIICTSKEVQNGNTIRVFEAEITNDSGELIAKGDMTYFNLRRNINEIFNLAEEQTF